MGFSPYLTPEPPVAHQLSPKYLVEGTNLTQKCLYDVGKPPETTVYWISQGDNTFRQQGDTLRLTNVQRNSSGNYTCTAENQYSSGNRGRSSQSLTIDVQYPPIVSPFTDRDIIEGSNFTVACVFTAGNPFQTTVYWIKSGESEFKQDGTILHLPWVQRNRAGTYICTTENRYNSGRTGTSSQSLEINVLYPPIVSHITNQDIIEGSNLTVQCSFTAGNPPQTTVYWIRSGDSGFRQNGRILQLQKIDRDSTGTYVCVAKNIYSLGGTGTSSRAMDVNVLCKPEVKKNITLGILDSEGIQFSATVIAYPKPSYKLYYENKTINNKMTSRLSKNAVNNFTVVYNQTHVQQSDFGVYLLEFENAYGRSLMYVNIISEGKPYPPEIKTVTCETKSADITWKSSFNGRAPQTFTAIAMRDDQYEASRSGSMSDKGENDIHRATINGLQPSVVYNFYVSALNKHGETLSAGDISCRTSAMNARAPDLKSLIGAIVGGTFGCIIFVAMILFVFLNRKYKIKCTDRYSKSGEKREEKLAGLQGNEGIHYEELKYADRLQESSYDAIRLEESDKNENPSATYESLQPTKEENKYKVHVFTDNKDKEKDTTYSNFS
ncbi:hemicentin-1-like [Saccostrea echinata]|uniref:hemicentin-1-like n=1 Tax=Saccostrea echinata TaxID=191078 RepID=UPI002A8334B7|nr:hemicentin-1-like [Saccostrea echinata]